MAKPATDARMAAAARGFTQVIGRGNASLITKDPSTGKCCYDGQVGGGWHYGNGLETDTAFVPAAAPWDFQMTKALYNVFALSNFSNGQIIKWVDPTTGQSVAFQPMALQWTNNLNQIQQISMPQSVAAQVSDDVFFWPAAYGTGRDFEYVAGTERLQKLLILAAGSLPSTTYDTLELNFIVAVSSGVSIIVNGQAWNKKSQVDTINKIEFRLSSGQTVWSFATPKAWDSSEMPGEVAGSIRLKNQGDSLYVSVRFPKSFFDAATYPVFVDPTVDYQVGTSGDDGYYDDMAGGGITTNSYVYCGYANHALVAFARWPTVIIPDGATITASYVSVYYNAKTGTPSAGTLYFEKAANPAAITSKDDGNGRTKTTASISFVPPGTGTWTNSGSINNLITELLAAFSYKDGAAMQMIWVGGGSGANYARYEGYDTTAARAIKLHIEYTEAAAGNPFYAYAQQ